MFSWQLQKALERELARAGVDRASPSPDDVATTWSVVRSLANRKVRDARPLGDSDSDALLAQFGTYDWGDGRHFSLDITRQITRKQPLSPEFSYHQLRCTFEFEPTEERDALGTGELWSFGLSRDQFFDRALVLPAFVVEHGTPTALQIRYDRQ